MAAAFLSLGTCVAPAGSFGASSAAQKAQFGTGEMALMFANARKGENLHRVVVSLKGLEAGPAWAERIARSRERVMNALRGHHAQVNREYDLIPALALTVDDAALEVLRSHPDVSTIAEDGTTTPGDRGTSPGTTK